MWIAELRETIAHMVAAGLISEMGRDELLAHLEARLEALNAT